MSLKLRLNLVITVVLALIFLASSVFLVREARRDVQAAQAAKTEVDPDLVAKLARVR